MGLLFGHRSSIYPYFRVANCFMNLLFFSYSSIIRKRGIDITGTLKIYFKTSECYSLNQLTSFLRIL
jgi:hypothetical protein